MKQAYRYLSILFIFFFVVDTMRADGGDVLERIVRLPKTKGTVYSLLGNVSQQSGYMFIYDSKVIDNDAVVKIKGGERSIRQAVYSRRYRFGVSGDWYSYSDYSPFGEKDSYTTGFHSEAAYELFHYRHFAG